MIDYSAELQRLLQENGIAKEPDSLKADIQELDDILKKINGRQTDISMQVEEIYEKLEELPDPRDNANTDESLMELLDIIEDFYRYAKGEAALREQAGMMWRMAGRAAAKAGLMRLDEEEMPFDAALHDIEQITEEEGCPHGMVRFTWRSGYLRDGKILRKARVTVNRQGGNSDGYHTGH